VLLSNPITYRVCLHNNEVRTVVSSVVVFRNGGSTIMLSFERIPAKCKHISV
jgi:hypothetical protein